MIKTIYDMTYNLSSLPPLADTPEQPLAIDCDATAVLHLTDGCASNEMSYCFPGREFILSARPITLGPVPLGYLFPLSFLTIIGRAAACTLLLTDSGLRSVSLAKDASGVTIRLQFTESIASHRLRLIGHAPDWHCGLDLYRRWYSSRYGRRHLHPRLTGCFQLWRYFLHPELAPGSPGHKAGFSEELQRLLDEFGGAEALLLFDLGYDPHTHVRCGNTAIYPASLPRELLRDVQESSLLQIYYLDPYLVQERSPLFHALPDSVWQTDAARWPLKLWRNDEWAPCLTEPLWQDICRGQLATAATQLSLDGVYFDELGFGTTYPCCSPGHAHAKPIDQPRAELEFVDSVAPPDLLRFCEAFPSDHELPAFHAALSDATSAVDISRFAHPEVRIFRMTQCDRPGDDLAGCLDKALFNGEGFFIGNDIANEQWYPAAIRQRIRRNHAILRRYAAIFDSSDCTPLVPLHSVCLANRFRRGNEAILTLLNPATTPQALEIGGLQLTIAPGTVRVIYQHGVHYHTVL